MKNNKSFKISNGFEPNQKKRAVRLFWEAFKGKLYLIMKPEKKALCYLEAAIDPTHAISATDLDGTLLGIAGFKTMEGAFIGGALKEMRQSYGLAGGVWRGVILSLLERPLQPDTLLMDGIFVGEEARGQGVGSALLTAIKVEAKTRGCRQVRLDVIDSNLRAKALYQRHGFIPGETTDLGLLRYLFGFREATIMTCQVN